MSSSLTSSSVSHLDLPEDAGFATFFWHLFSKEKYTDVHFHLEYKNTESSFSAHRLILALRSAFFADEFFGSSKKRENVIKLCNVNPEAFKAMLNYMYDYTPSITSPKVACEIFKVADRFQVTSLKNLCKKSLNSMNIKSSNVFDMLEASEYLQNASTKDCCLKFIQDNTKEVISSYDLSEISPSVISHFLSFEKLSLDSELDLFNFVFDWAQKRSNEDLECDGNAEHSENTNAEYSENTKCITIRDILQNYFSKLPFASLSSQQFAQLLTSYKNVFHKDEIINIFMNFATSGSQWTQMPNWYNQNCTLILKPIGQVKM